MKRLAGFFGTTLSSVKTSELYIALNSYGTDRGFEEWHAHEHASISFLLNGSHDEELRGKLFKRKAGDIKFIAAGESHRCNHYTDNSRKINIELPPLIISRICFKEDDLERVITDDPQTKFTFLKFYRKMLDIDGSCPASWQLLLLELLYPISNTNNRQHKKPPVWVSRLKELLYEHCHEQLELADIAVIVGVHPVTISRYFPRYFDMTLSAYVRNMRIAKALPLIKSGDQSLTEIGLACGFSDQSHFTHSFKKVTGFLPKVYRIM